MNFSPPGIFLSEKLSGEEYFWRRKLKAISLPGEELFGEKISALRKK
jgi:hypothetical protein